MVASETVSTSTMGYVFESTLIGQETCSIPLFGNTEAFCLHFVLHSQPEGPFIAGEYWLIEQHGVAGMTISGLPGRYVLADFVDP